MRVICIGECMVELRAAGPGLYARGFAGDAYNTAVYLKRAAPGAQWEGGWEGVLGGVWWVMVMVVALHHLPLAVTVEL